MTLRHISFFLLLASTNVSSATTIDFETTPTGETPIDNTLLTSAYTVDGVTVTFSIDTGNGPTAPVFEFAGDSDPISGFGTTLPSGQTNGPTDTAADGFADRLGQWFLRPETNAGGQNLKLSVEYTSTSGPITAASGEIWDIEGREDPDSYEQWEVTAFDASGTVLAVETSPKGTDIWSPFDGRPWRFEFSGLSDISRIEANYVGNVPAGIAFDNFTPTTVPEPTSFAWACLAAMILRRRRTR
ncbi:MAG: hypothetical protein KDB27_22090 [Planctomycetales bacterium]|nr:hypothetical protein [Planctomycetales bacterium]